MSAITERLQKRVGGLRARDQELAAQAERIAQERRTLADQIGEIEVALRVIHSVEVGDEGNGTGPGVPMGRVQSSALLTPQIRDGAIEALHAQVRAAQTVPEACAIALRSLGGEAPAKQVYRLLIESGRLAPDRPDQLPGSSYNRMAGALRKAPKRFEKVGFARWRLRSP